MMPATPRPSSIPQAAATSPNARCRVRSGMICRSRASSSASIWAAVPTYRSETTFGRPPTRAISRRYQYVLPLIFFGYRLAINLGHTPEQPRGQAPNQHVTSRNASASASHWASDNHDHRKLKLEAPAGRAVWLGRAQREDRHGGYFVHVPGGRPRARRTELGVKGAVAHGRLPSLGCVHLRDALELGFIGHPHSLTLHDKVEPVCGDRDGAVRVVREVLGFAGRCASVEVQGAIHPQDPQRHDVGPAVWTHRRQPAGMPCGSARSRTLGKSLLEALAHPGPRDRRRAIAIEVPLSHRLLRSHLSSLLSVVWSSPGGRGRLVGSLLPHPSGCGETLTVPR